MKVLQIPYPDTLPDATRQSVGDFEQDLRMALAAKLFEMGRVSSGQAAEMAKVSRYAFLHALSNFHVCAVDWDASELDLEIENA